MELNELIEQEKERVKEQEKALAVQPEAKPVESGLDVVSEQRKKDLEAIAQNKTFQEQSLGIHTRGVVAQLRGEEVEIENQELKNELEAYAVKKKKEELDYRAKKEKDIVRQEVKAQVFERKYAIAKKRYGYLYTSKWEDKLDENGQVMKDDSGNIIKVEVPSKDFTPNKTINKFKEIAHYYNNLSKTAQKMIWTTIKLVLICGAVALGAYLLWELIKFISSSGIA